MWLSIWPHVTELFRVFLEESYKNKFISCIIHPADSPTLCHIIKAPLIFMHCGSFLNFFNDMQDMMVSTMAMRVFYGHTPECDLLFTMTSRKNGMRGEREKISILYDTWTIIRYYADRPALTQIENVFNEA